MDCFGDIDYWIPAPAMSRGFFSSLPLWDDGRIVVRCSRYTAAISQLTVPKPPSREVTRREAGAALLRRPHIPYDPYDQNIRYNRSFFTSCLR